METIENILVNSGPFQRLMLEKAGTDNFHAFISLLIERTGVMVLQFDEELRIENPRNYPPEVVGDLHYLLSTGGQAKRDPRRKDIFEIQGRDSTLYVYVSPLTRAVVLLARWSRKACPSCVEMAGEIA